MPLKKRADPSEALQAIQTLLERKKAGRQQLELAMEAPVGEDDPTSSVGPLTVSLPDGRASRPSGQAPLQTNAVGGTDPDLQWLIQKESSGRTSAKNPKSTAFGLGQLLIANRKAYAKKLGIKDPNTTDYNEQLAMMKAYIADRYGSSKAARQFWEKNRWY